MINPTPPQQTEELLAQLEQLPCIHSNAFGQQQFRLSVEQRDQIVTALRARAPDTELPGAGDYVLVPREITEAQADVIGMPRQYFERAVAMLAVRDTRKDKPHEG
jgi:hypothetical protein